MDAQAWIALGSAIVSVLSLITTVFFAVRAGNSANRSQSSATQAQHVAVGSAETTLRSAISTTRQRFGDLSVQLAEVVDGRRPDQLNARDRRRMETLEKALRSAVEDNLNAYEDACGKYLDGKIDKTRFKKTYNSEIQNLYTGEKSMIADLMLPDATSNFQAIWKVYKEWYIHE